mmetsp:Transcript_16723/g.38356  ORF Transcript_16723/g.38356 Transcript_16723/m.38356 type:complete len:249 (-) Transcript_16723:218-964(-)
MEANGSDCSSCVKFRRWMASLVAWYVCHSSQREKVLFFCLCLFRIRRKRKVHGFDLCLCWCFCSLGLGCLFLLGWFWFLRGTALVHGGENRRQHAIAAGRLALDFCLFLRSLGGRFRSTLDSQCLLVGFQCVDRVVTRQRQIERLDFLRGEVYGRRRIQWNRSLRGFGTRHDGGTGHGRPQQSKKVASSLQRIIIIVRCCWAIILRPLLLGMQSRRCRDPSVVGSGHRTERSGSRDAEKKERDRNYEW